MLQEKERQFEELSNKKNALQKEIVEIEKKEYGLLLERKGLIAQRNGCCKCAVINPLSNMILKTVIEIHDEEYREIEDFHNNIRFNVYYVNGEEYMVTDDEYNSYLLLNYKYEIGNERKFILDNQQYKVSRRERGYDRSDTYYSWKIPVEIPFSWIEE